LLINVSDENIIKRLLPPRLERWRARVNAKKEKKKLIKEKKQKELVNLKYSIFLPIK
jgi:hypothetical protein